MMKWYSELYVGEQVEGRQDEIRRKIDAGERTPGIFLITEAANGVDLFDILSSAYLQQSNVRRQLPMIVGIAQGRAEALALVCRIVDETCRMTHGADVRAYLAGKSRAGAPAGEAT